ncbi:AbrB family looped-hinge helix DNA binding protein [Sulfurisphaera ohwakuensis]|uniref:AbrB family looped-hinge helix DNA binding protein n=2 Tax=Sulfurisphaera ohwakuensis TaxID=69656 RepID=A0A7J9RWV1_SULOH|nr:AbrB family looped-hinge helix DNA binding protein [Sulfurisphaera ohwakuensis]
MELMKKEYLLNVDEKGRIVIPKEVREEFNITEKVKLVVEDDKIELLPYVKKSYRGLFKASLNSKDVDEVLKEALEERSKKWLRDILM